MDNQDIFLGRLQLHSGMFSNSAEPLELLEMSEGTQHLSKVAGNSLEILKFAKEKV